MARREPLWKRIGPDAIVTMAIAAGAVIAAQIVFQQHTRDFEADHLREFDALKARIAVLEAEDRRRVGTEAATEIRLDYIERFLMGKR